jgi:PAS domain S-box-containing protein
MTHPRSASGTDALRLADETNPDLVLMDIRIQGDMDGIEVATHLNVSHPLPVIYLTAHSEDATIARDRTTRPYGYLLKPFSDREMHATILMALERRKVEVELRDSEERLRLALDAAAMGVWDMDADTRSVTISDKSIDILGLTGPSPVRYEHLLECVEQADRERVAAEFERCLAQLAPYRVEFRSTAGDDDKRWVRFEARPRNDRRVIGVVQNISKRKLAEEALRELHENLEAQVADRTAELRRSLGELNTFSYSIAHDLRAPLRSIIGFSQMLLADHGENLDDTGKRFLGKVSAAGTHMGQLIDGLLNLSRLTRSHMSRNEVDMSAMATEIAQRLRDADPQRRVNFIIAPGLTAYADKVLIVDLFDNVFQNAWKFTSKHPAAQIEFGVRQIDGETVYFVSDDGAGFDMTYADKLFRPFHRLHRSDEFEGTGIGLSTVQRIVARHGGRIWAEAAVEKGATFCFTLAPTTH